MQEVLTIFVAGILAGILLRFGFGMSLRRSREPSGYVSFFAFISGFSALRSIGHVPSIVSDIIAVVTAMSTILFFLTIPTNAPLDKNEP